MELFKNNGSARATDPKTSQEAAKMSSKERVTAKMRLLKAYDDYGHISDEHAGNLAGVKGAHKRISELLKEGYLKHVGEERGVNGTDVRLCGLTPDGEELAEQLNVDLKAQVIDQSSKIEEVMDMIEGVVNQFGEVMDSMHRVQHLPRGASMTLKEWVNREQVNIDKAMQSLDRLEGLIHDR